MEWNVRLQNETIVIRKIMLGDDILITVEGGTPHVGCVVLASPRPSLSGDESVSCTSSVINVIGHKDEIVCRYLAEKAAKKYNTSVVCTGGIHIDGITAEEIQEIVDKLQALDI